MLQPTLLQIVIIQMLQPKNWCQNLNANIGVGGVNASK